MRNCSIGVMGLLLVATAAMGQVSYVGKITEQAGDSMSISGFAVTGDRLLSLTYVEATDSHVVRVYDIPSGAVTATLAAPSLDDPENAAFGEYVAAAGDTALVTSYVMGDSWQDDEGNIHIGERVGTVTTWDLSSGVMTGPTFAEGSCLALGGGRVLIGDTGNGAAYVYDGVTGAKLQTLTAPASSAGDSFGGNVTISGDFAAVSAPSDSAAYLYNLSTGAQVGQFTPDQSLLGQGFGYALDSDHGVGAVSCDALRMGASEEEYPVYIFDMATGAQLHKLLPDDGASSERDFGHSVAVGDDFVVVGAPLDGAFEMGPDWTEHQGAAYVFDLTTGEQIAKLTAPDWDEGTAPAWFGFSVAAEGDMIYVSAPWEWDVSGPTPAVYAYQVPEPASMALLALGAAALRRRRR